MSEQEKQDQVMDHDYDGIKEFDNPMPGWWIGIFWITVIFSICYFVWYHAPVEGRSVYDGYEQAKVEMLQAQFKDIGEIDPLKADAPTISAWAKNEDFDLYRKIGKAIFRANCAGCHGEEATGLVGPNLTDGKWKHVRVITDIPRVITNGANNGAMPARGGANLSPTEVAVVSSYVASLRDAPKPGKSISGETEIAPWPEPSATAHPASRPAK